MDVRANGLTMPQLIRPKRSASGNISANFNRRATTTAQIMDIVYLHGIKLETVIGVWEWERHIKQTLLLDLDIGTDTSVAGQSDALEDTINYQAIAELVMDIAKQNSFALVEALAETISTRLLQDFPVKWVRLRINKQGAVRGVKDVGIVIEREQT